MELLSRTAQHESKIQRWVKRKRFLKLDSFYYFRKKLYQNPTYSVHRGEANRTRWKLPESGMVFISPAGPPGWCKKITSYLGIRSHYSPNQIWGVITVIALLCSLFVLITLFSPARDRRCLVPDSSHFRVSRLKFIPAALPRWKPRLSSALQELLSFARLILAAP